MVADLILRQEQEMSAGVPAVLGKPPGTRQLTDAEELALWDFRDPSVNPYELHGQGLPWSDISRKLHPARFKLIEQNGQDRAEQTAYAERMARRSENERAKQAQDQQPAPMTPSLPGGGQNDTAY